MESGRFNDPVLGIPVFSFMAPCAGRATADAVEVRCAADRPAGSRLPHLHLHHHAASTCCEAAATAWQGGLGARSAQSRPGGPSRADAAPGLGELCRRRRHCRCATASPWASWRAGSSRRCKLDVDYACQMEGWAPDCRAGLRLAARRAQLDQPEPECTQSVDGALLCRHGHARRHDAVGRPRHDAAARALRRVAIEPPGRLALPSFIVPAHRRPWRSQTASLNRLPGKCGSGVPMSVIAIVRRSTRASPLEARR